MSADRFGRIRREAAPDIRSDGERHLSDSVAEFPFQIWNHRAHAVMLTEVGILKAGEEKAILRALEALEEKAKGAPRLSIYMDSEAFIIAEAGESGGKMHTGRSRNDLGAAVLRMLVRDQLNRLTVDVINFSRSLLEKARKNLNTVMRRPTNRYHAYVIAS